MRRVALLNRGEAAMRFLRSLREYSFERGMKLEVVAFYTQPDQDAPFVRLADRAISLGAPLAQEGGEVKSAYCVQDKLLGLILGEGCDAVWPGWGFLSEDAGFVEKLEKAGVIFMGPSSGAMRRLGDKIASKQLAEACGVPLAPWALLEAELSQEEVLSRAGGVGYPLMVKASAGGGGRGIRRVGSEGELLAAVRGVREEAERSFGSGGVFLEACVEGARHVEVQLVAAASGEVTALGVRDCSIQRRHQKVIEETPSPILPQEMEALLCASACRLASEAGYQGVGTAEFLYNPRTKVASFLEVNSRLQVEHTITELIAGCDLVKAQIDIARGIAWEKPLWGLRGHAIEVRLNAEDPERGFLPSPGLVRVFQPPAGPGIRVDSGIREGLTIPSAFDSMIAKVMAWGQSREEARARLLRALREMQIVIEDGATNKAFLLSLLEHPAFIEASADTAWLDRAMAEGDIAPPKHMLEALYVAAIVEYNLQERTEMLQFFAQAQDGIPQDLPAPKGRRIGLRVRGCAKQIEVYCLGRHRYLVGQGAALQRVTLEATGAHTAILQIEQASYGVLYAIGRSGIMVEVDGAMHAVERLQSGMVKAPSPALVIQIAVEEGQRVEAGDLLCSLEAMKMEMPVIAQEAGIVRAIQCQAHQQVHAGQVLLVLEPLEAGEAQGRDEKQKKKKAEASLGDQDASAAPRSSRLSQIVEESGKVDHIQLAQMGKGGEAKLLIAEMAERIEAAMLGFDLPSSDAVRLEALLRDPVGLVEQIKPLELLPLVRLLGAFAQSEALFERNLLPLPQQAAAISAEIDFYDVCRKHHEGEAGIREAFRPLLRSALRWYGVYEMEQQEPLREALWRLAVGHAHGALRHRLCSSLLRLSMALYAAGVGVEHEEGLRETLEQVTKLASERYAFVADNARQASYEIFVRSRYMQRREEIEATLSQLFAQMEGTGTHSEQQDALVEQIIRSPHSVFSSLLQRGQPSQPSAALLMRALLGRLYLEQRACVKAFEQAEGIALARLSLVGQDEQSQIGMILCEEEALPRALALWKARRESLCAGQPVALVEVMLTGTLRKKGFVEELDALCQEAALHESGSLQWVFSWCQGHDRLCHRNYRVHEAALIEDPILRDIHPQAASRLELWRLQAFSLVRLPTPEKLYAFRATARSNPQDTRIFVFGEIRSVPPSLASTAQDSDQLWEFEQVYFEALRVIREVQAQQEVRRRLHWNRIFLYIQPLVDVEAHDLVRLSHRFEAATRGLGLEKIVIRARSLRESDEGEGVASAQTRVFVLHKPGRHRLEVKEMPPAWTPIRAMTPYEIKVVQARRLGYVYPYEILRMLLGEAKDAAAPHPDMRGGSFVEYDLDEKGERLLPIERPFGQNQSGVIVGLIRHQTAKHPEGMERVWIASDPTAAMGALAEPECRRVIAAIDLAEERGLPIEWLPISSGARIAMQSGTENLDWTARVLKRIIEYTQGGGLIHLIVAGVNVGAQSYWNAEATMLMHTRGLLIMTPQGAMVLTGKKALEYSGGVAAEDERGMGGFERIMGPNGQAQYFARDLGEAYAILFSSYRFSYISPHERRPRRFPTADPHERSILTVPYRGASSDGFNYIGDIFDERTNPGRKKPFAIREVMAAVIDQDGGHLERYRAMRHAETAVVWDAHLGGHAVSVIGFESQPLPRRGRIPMDGPDLWTGGTLFPQSSKKVAWGIRAASGQRPVVVLANLSGFDGSPESLRKLQLEMGAEIGRAVVNFQGSLVFVVIGRYHGGAYVVFSKSLNPSITALALEGSFASVIGGAPAAAVVFPHESRKRAEADERILAARERLHEAPSEKKPRLREELDQMFAQILLEKQAEVAREFDAIHTVERAVSVGSLDAVLRPALLRPALIAILDAKG